MAETIIKYISLDNLSIYQELQKDYIDSQIAPTLKTVALSNDETKLLFYTVAQPVGSTPPAFEIELPKTDLSRTMSKVVSAIQGNIATFGTGGQVVDSGTKLSDLATKNYVDNKVAQGVAGASALTKRIVTSVPSASEATENVIYLLKVESVEGSDKYEEYTLISGQMVMIGDTSTDLSGYLTQEEAQSIANTAKQEAITAASTDATTKAEKALTDANKYTDTELKKVADRVSAIETDMSTSGGDITNINNTLTTHGDKIAALEGKVNAIKTASTQDIYSLFGKTAPTS